MKILVENYCVDCLATQQSKTHIQFAGDLFPKTNDDFKESSSLFGQDLSGNLLHEGKIYL